MLPASVGEATEVGGGMHGCETAWKIMMFFSSASSSNSEHVLFLFVCVGRNCIASRGISETCTASQGPSPPQKTRNKKQKLIIVRDNYVAYVFQEKT